MNDKEYTLVVNNRQARPRSKRLRELGLGGNIQTYNTTENNANYTHQSYTSVKTLQSQLYSEKVANREPEPYIIGPGEYELPELEIGECKEIKYIRCNDGKNDGVSVLTTSGNAVIVNSISNHIDPAYSTRKELLYGVYDIIGYNYDGQTMWCIILISNE